MYWSLNIAVSYLCLYVLFELMCGKLRNTYNIIRKEGIREGVVNHLFYRIYFKEKNEIIQAYLKKEVTSHVVELINGKRFMLNTKDEGVSFDIMVNQDKMREDFATKFLLEYLSEKDGQGIFLDVGANIGYYTVILSDYFKKIISVEPLQENIVYLRKNVSINSLNNKVTIINGAVGEKKGFTYIAKNRALNLSKIAEPFDLNNETKLEKISSYRLMDLPFDGNITFLKMDVEGYEYNILNSNKDFFEKISPDNMFIEIHFDLLNNRECKEILNLLQEWGYYVKKAFVEVKGPIYLWKDLKKHIFQTYLERVIYKRKIGEIYSEVSIATILEDESLIGGRLGAIEFIFSKNI